MKPGNDFGRANGLRLCAGGGNADLSPIQHLWDHFLEQLDPPLRDGFLNRDPLQKGGRILMVKDREDTGEV